MPVNQTFSALAVKLLSKFEAVPCTVRRVTRTFDPIAQTSTSVNVDTVTTTVLSTIGEKNSTGQTITSTVALIAAATLASAPMSDDLLVVGSTTYRVNSVDITAPLGVALVYRLTLGAV